MATNTPERPIMTCTRCGKRAADTRCGLCQRCKEAAHIEAQLDARLAARRKAREAVNA